VERLRPSLPELGEDALAHARRWRWPQLQVREGGLEVEARAPHDDRAAVCGERRVDLLVCQRRELAGREGLAHRHERDEPVLEPPLLLRGGDAGQDLQSAVDLEGVGGDRNRILAAPAEALRELDRHGRLADSGRAEDGYDGFGCGHDR
jgi:hypothetical protein